MVLDTAVYHPSLLKLIRFLDTTAGREKVLRGVQYLCRFLAFYLLRKGYTLETSKLFSSLQKNMAFTRKAMRFLKPLNHLQDASKAYDNKLMDPVLRYATVVRNVSYMGYLSADSLAWFKLLGVMDTKRLPQLSKVANWFWFGGLISGLVNELRKLQIDTLKRTALVSEEKVEQAELVKVNSALFAAKRKTFATLTDLFIVLNNLGYLHNDEGAIGAAGTITSVMGLQDLWKACK
ncbi:hypothetical protein BABINDRAFT_66105 [Babjeviella inositovora NRRL Y-12698]|uniref:Peroxisomal membrane protein PMP27 n=1 Tax=Babjeviella inositovora NRRL Y-12698 TaxID=984486 RepID=A0A1E3QK46_9ASCO|nr:uncharacterized protein BABINDRAFT_66105 [Babjeviella inositovora NRRL Y-12698]ODQ78061.1 hypothetical protein BABINDRAFT_66105 [Babjeviella inositovora NRRL Y-12698]